MTFVSLQASWRGRCVNTLCESQGLQVNFVRGIPVGADPEFADEQEVLLAPGIIATQRPGSTAAWDLT